jgi:hypothetical protein
MNNKKKTIYLLSNYLYRRRKKIHIMNKKYFSLRRKRYLIDLKGCVFLDLIESQQFSFLLL